MKEQRQAVKAIKEHLAGGGTDGYRDRRGHRFAGSEVLWYVAIFKKYGEVLEGAQAATIIATNWAIGSRSRAGPGLSSGRPFQRIESWPW
jgi:hypothetical protein